MNTIGELLERNARFYPHKEALVCEGRRYTYRQLVDRTRRVADGLHRLGLRRQDRVAILAMNCAEYMEVLGAGDWAGFIVATVNFRLAAPEIEWMLGDASPRVLVFEAQYADLVAGLRARLPGIVAYVCIGGTAPEWARGYEELVASGSPEGPPFRAQPGDYGPLVYTSGTTGRPKGALRSQWRWLATAEGGAYASDFSSETRALLTSSARADHDKAAHISAASRHPPLRRIRVFACERPIHHDLCGAIGSRRGIKPRRRQRMHAVGKGR